MSEPPVSIIILAAGSSRRLGRPKQLLDLGGEPLIRHTVRNAVASKASEVVVVLGNSANEIAEAIGGLASRIVVNARFADGQGTSLVAGLNALDTAAEAAIFMLGDQPTVDTGVLDQLIDRFGGTNARIVQPHYDDGRPGNPVLIRSDLFPELMELTGDIGARDVIRAHRDEIERLDLDHPQPPDVDTEEEYQALRAEWATGTFGAPPPGTSG